MRPQVTNSASGSSAQPTRSAQEITPKERRRVLTGTLVGTVIEWYDFFIYALAANIVFAQLFFAPAGEEFQRIFSLVTIGLSFLFRPLGAAIAGRLGDRFGRKPLLVVTLIMMGIATTTMGLLPTYDQIGLWAPFLLLALRILQGISAGGEWGGAVLMSVEYAPKGRRGFYGAFPQIGVPTGMLLASAVLAVVTWIAPGQAFYDWGWRIPFLLSLVLVIVGLFVRSAVDESPVFNEIAELKSNDKAAGKANVKPPKLFPKFGIIVMFGILLIAGNGASGYMITGGYIQGVATRPIDDGGLGYDQVGVQLAVLVAAAVWLISTLTSGWLADKYGRRRIMALGWFVQAAGIIPLFELVKNFGVTGVLIGTSLLAVGLGMTYGPQAVWYAELFPASVRYSGVSISYALGAILGGAFAPTIAELLLNGLGTTWAIVIYLLAMAALGLVGTVMLKETRDIRIDYQFEASGDWDKWNNRELPLSECLVADEPHQAAPAMAETASAEPAKS
ncbi:MFS transporter [Enteractinococcus coprophilus]|uniref:Putative proline/betaine transporter n=1 Tax=Enteractinococcus coprophilus TaxID=1027633 RepID=A0A543AG55_9MICC|nr:MFS transporter [Enteractinococcus coprophilus]TQL71559.1 sugar phosphate permease [Enteractinococcus coprophilus]